MDLKIGDFGLAAQLVNDSERKRTICGTPNYLAPEVLDSNKTAMHGHSYQVDVWSVGCILYAMLYGRPPFESSEVKHTYFKIRKGSFKFPENVLPSTPGLDLAKKLVSECLVVDPSKRITLEEIRQHEYLTGAKLP